MYRIRNLMASIIAGLVFTFGIILLLQPGSVSAQAPEPTQVITNGLAYLQTQQQSDGGMLGFSGISDPDTTARAVIAFTTAGKPVSEVISGTGSSMLDYLVAQAISFTHDTTGTLFPGRAGLLLTAVSVAGDTTTDFGGMDLATELEGSFHTDTGAYSSTALQGYSSGSASDLSQAWVILGLSLAGRPIPDGASQYLYSTQGEDGSWGFGDPDTTALVMTALLASQKADGQSDPVQKALGFFHTTQLDGGGWKPSWDTDPVNADSTGWILQALVSAGEDPQSESWTKNEANPVLALLGLQKPDGTIGGTYANTYSTAEAIIGLSAKPLASLVAKPTTQRAGLAIFYGDDTYYSSCISFTETSLTGLDLLEHSGLAVETATNPSQGTAVCKIDETGSSAENCFGSMPNYWSYWQLGANGWEYAAVGAGQAQVKDGDVNAWSWGAGNQPPSINFQNICEGVAFEMPQATETSLPATNTPPPTQLPTLTAASTQTQAIVTEKNTQAGVGTYVVYGSILVVLAALIIYLVRFRAK